MEDRGNEPRAHGLGNQSGNLASPTVMRKTAKRQRPKKAKVKAKLGTNRPVPKHQKNFEALLDLAVRGQK